MICIRTWKQSIEYIFHEKTQTINSTHGQHMTRSYNASASHADDGHLAGMTATN